MVFYLLDEPHRQQGFDRRLSKGERIAGLNALRVSQDDFLIALSDWLFRKIFQAAGDLSGFCGAIVHAGPNQRDACLQDGPAAQSERTGGELNGSAFRILGGEFDGLLKAAIGKLEI